VTVSITNVKCVQKIRYVSIFEALGKDKYNILQYQNTTQQNCENLI